MIVPHTAGLLQPSRGCSMKPKTNAEANDAEGCADEVDAHVLAVRHLRGAAARYTNVTSAIGNISRRSRASS